MLYLIPTPIGHLSDITLRALELLKSVDYILCEDTRHSQKLLSHYSITTSLKSFHKFSEKKEMASIVNDLEKGLDIAIISDAGTPCICDPGQALIKHCHDKGLAIDALPGPCAVTTAFCASGFTSQGFTFRGFFPKKEQEQKNSLVSCFYHSLPTGFFESPHRLLKTLQLIDTMMPDRDLFLAKEMTKKFQTFYRGLAAEILSLIGSGPVKGEYLFFIGPCNQERLYFKEKPLEEVAFLMEQFQLPKKEAIKIAAYLHNVSKSQVYQEVEEA